MKNYDTNKTQIEFADGMSEHVWVKRYLDPIRAVKEGGEPSDEMADGFAGFVLDGILATKLIHGWEANDWECVLLVEQLITEAKEIVRYQGAKF